MGSALKIPILLILLTFSPVAFALNVKICSRVLAHSTLSLEVELDLPLEPFIPSLSSGKSNRGLYAYSDAEGQRHAVKVLDFGPGKKHSEQDFESAVEGAKLLELTGGPKFYGSGVIEVKEGRTPGKYYFLDLECLGSGINLKTDRIQDIVELLTAAESRATLPIQISKSLIDSIEKKIFASDPDLWIEPSGNVRWIDSGEWRGLASDRADLKYTAGTVWYFVYKLSQLDDRMRTSLASNFLNDFLARLGNSNAVSQDDRRVLIEHFTDLPAHDAQGAIPPLWAEHFLIRYRILPPDQRNQEEAHDMFCRYCAAAMQRLP